MTTREKAAKRIEQLSRQLVRLALEHPHVSDIGYMRIREAAKSDRQLARALRNGKAVQ